MNNEFSLSELYEVVIKTTYPIEIGDKVFTTGETLCVFDKVQIANFNEIKNYVSARGGFDNIERVSWEKTKEVDITFSQGIFNQLQFALLCNAKMIYIQEQEPVLLFKREEVESTSGCVVTLSHPVENNLFIYDKATGERVQNYTWLNDQNIQIDTPYLDVIVDYNYIYDNGAQVVKIGKALISGYLSLEGKTRVKDDISGKTKTGIIKIPRLKLMSDLSMRLGKNANPMVANFRVKALPSGDRVNPEVMNILFLNDDIDSDM